MFFDIETIPLEKERHHVLNEIREKLEADGKNVKDFETMLSETCFDGGLGRIACISYALNDGNPVTLKGDETQILKDFWEVAKTVNLFVGFNVFSFDLRFIYQRSIVLKVKPSVELSFARYRNFPIYDIMCEWVKWDYNNHISMDRLAKALDLPTSKGGEVEGKNVAKAFEEGRIDEICEYCEKDVELTRVIYKKMTFEDGEDDFNY
jgi:predicted PolB exonuclease-like 3'-5' exonuclease